MTEPVDLPCEASGCKSAIKHNNIRGPNGDPSGWQRWTVPAGWVVGWIGFDPTLGLLAATPHGRLVVLCPTHGVSVG